MSNINNNEKAIQKIANFGKINYQHCSKDIEKSPLYSRPRPVKKWDSFIHLVAFTQNQLRLAQCQLP